MPPKLSALDRALQRGGGKAKKVVKHKIELSGEDQSKTPPPPAKSKTPPPPPKSPSPPPDAPSSPPQPHWAASVVANAGGEKAFENALGLCIEYLRNRRSRGLTDLATVGEIEAAAKTQLSPAKGHGVRHPETQETLLECLQQSSVVTVVHRRVAPGKVQTMLKYAWKYDVRSLDDLLKYLRSLDPIEGERGMRGRNGVLLEDIVGCYKGCEEDIANAVLQRKIIAFAPGAPLRKKEEESQDDFDFAAAAQRRRKRVAELIVAKSGYVRLYHRPLGPAGVLDFFQRRMPEEALAEWNGVKWDEYTRGQIYEENAEDKIPVLRQMKTQEADTLLQDKGKKRRAILRRELNSHMKTPDARGIAYDFTRPFNPAEAEQRKRQLAAYNKRKRQRVE
eukprot:Sspe_Gene.28443::Locus_12910_Transcript_1_1_Confidence_1.000_Length_2347::g.28443::m.28443